MTDQRGVAPATRAAVGEAASATEVVVFAAGSLRVPFTDLAHAFERVSGHSIALTFGASGLLRDRIGGGEPAHVFASANMEHPRALAANGWAERVDLFARNRMCLLAGSHVAVRTDTALDTMLDTRTKLGTSTPTMDPCGDYAWEVFRRADALRPGAFATLTEKALQLVGRSTSAPTLDRGSVYGILVSAGKADVFLTYTTNADLACRQFPQMSVVTLPEALAVGAEYGVAMRSGAPSPAREFVAFLRWTESQRVLSAYGFDPP